MRGLCLLSRKILIKQRIFKTAALSLNFYFHFLAVIVGHNKEYSLKMAIGDKKILCRSGFHRENLKYICPFDELLMKRK